jgi:hypothetical protein
MDERELLELDADIVRRKTLRFLYVRSHRFPQFVDYVKALETTRYQYFAGADAGRIIEMVKTGRIPADDSTYAHTEQFEDDVLAALARSDWGALAGQQVSEPKGVPYEVSRRKAFKWVDGFRSKFVRGDRG